VECVSRSITFFKSSTCEDEYEFILTTLNSLREDFAVVGGAILFPKQPELQKINFFERCATSKRLDAPIDAMFENKSRQRRNPQLTSNTAFSACFMNSSSHADDDDFAGNNMTQIDSLHCSGAMLDSIPQPLNATLRFMYVEIWNESFSLSVLRFVINFSVI
jgi:hypothetical protein